MSLTWILPVMSLASLCPRSAFAPSALGVRHGWLADWGIPYSGSQFSGGFARNVPLGWRGAGLYGESVQARRPDPGAAGGNGVQSRSESVKPLEPVSRDCLKLRKINHLQHTTGATHYRGCPCRVTQYFRRFP